MMMLLLAILALQGTDRVDSIWEAALHQLNRKVDEAYHDGKFEECVGLLRAMRGFDPKDEDLAENLVFMLRNVERKEEAFAEATKFLRENPKSSRAAADVARFHFADKKWQAVVDTLERYIHTSDDPGLFTMLGRSYEELRRPKDALRIWQVRLKKQPDDPVAKRNVERLKQKIGG